jgi:hypothetical protein
MKVIRANTRVQFTAADMEFILAALRPKVDSVDCLVKLLTDEDTRDQVLDDQALLQAVLQDCNCLRISSHFYFYILVRQVLRRAGIDERGVADYVAAVLTEFSLTERSRCRIAGQETPVDYFFEMLAALKNADARDSFHIRAHIGNYSLFMSGVFPDRIRCRAELRGFPDLKYYEALGRSNFRVVQDHQLARRYELSGIFATLAERFDAARRALNDLSERLVTLGDPDCSSWLSPGR